MELDVGSGYPVRYSLIALATMKPIGMAIGTNSHQSVRGSNVQKPDNASREDLESSLRFQLFDDAFGGKIPRRDTPGTAALYKFIDGKTISHRDSLELLEQLPPGLDLLIAMQKLQPSFVPILNLTTGFSEAVISQLEHANGSGVRFGVHVRGHLPKDTRDELRKVMTSPQSRVTSVDFMSFHFNKDEQTEATRALLRECINRCDTLECVSGSPPVLELLERSVKEVRVTFFAYPLEKFSEELLRVLSLGDVEKFSLDRKDISMVHRPSQLVVHKLVADAVVEANEKLPALRSVRQVELSTRGLKTADDIPDEDREYVVDRLFSAKHVTHIVLPGPSWVPRFSRVREAYEGGHWLQSLLSLEFTPRDGYASESIEGAITDDKMEWLRPITERNRQLPFLQAAGAGGGFARTMMVNLRAQDLEIAPLAKHLMETLNTNDAKALAVIDQKTAKGASEGRNLANLQYQTNLQVRSSPQAANTQSSDGDTNTGPGEH